jgi:pimeloyl-ACP methyl ester carboxylesterase
VASKWADLDGPVHYLDFGGEGPPLVLVHGLAGSSLNWLAVGGGLAATGRRTLALDLRGFGRTPRGQGSRLLDQGRLLDRFVREVAGPPATLAGNSMGGLLSVRQAAAHPETVRDLVLVDPALPWRGGRPFDLPLLAFSAALVTPLLGDHALGLNARRWGAERVVDAAFRLCCADPGRIAPEVRRAHVEQEIDRLATLASQRALAQAARSLSWALIRRGHGRVYERVRAPVLVLHGELDRLVPASRSVAIGRHFGWPVQVLPGVGHLPMLETPVDFLRRVPAWLESPRPVVP